MKIFVSVGVLLVSIFVLVGCGNVAQQSKTNTQMSITPVEASARAEKIEVVDFHGTRRCYSCEMIERYAREILEEYFQQELNDETITFQSVNGELSANSEIVIKYQARGSSLFVNAIRDGEDNIEEDTMVWRLVGDEEKFKLYFKKKIEDLLR